MKKKSILVFLVNFFLVLFFSESIFAQQLNTAGVAAELLIRQIGNGCIRITLKPLSYKEEVSKNPALVNAAYPPPVIRIRSIDKKIVQHIGNLTIDITGSPLTIHITNRQQQLVQHLVFETNNSNANLVELS